MAYFLAIVNQGFIEKWRVLLIISVGLILRSIDLLYRGSKRYFCPLGRKIGLLASRFIAQWTKICAMTPANAYTKIFPRRKIKPVPLIIDRDINS